MNNRSKMIEHVREAERLLDGERRTQNDPGDFIGIHMAAQVHATLAQAYATMAICSETLTIDRTGDR